jgi:hypothetical protein
MLPTNCPSCGGPLQAGFVQAGRELICWHDADPAETIEGLGVPLQRRPEVKSFRLFLGDLNPIALRARRCEACRCLALEYGDSRETARD